MKYKEPVSVFLFVKVKEIGRSNGALSVVSLSLLDICYIQLNLNGQ